MDIKKAKSNAKELLDFIKCLEMEVKLSENCSENKFSAQNSLCILSDKESSELSRFKLEHFNSCGNSSRFIYDILHTGIGTIIKVRCPVCEKDEDITDNGSW